MTEAQHLKNEILEKCKQYVALVHNMTTLSTPTPKKINYAGRIFDENEVCSLVESSLEFWLTYGRYSKEFENKLAQFLGSRWAFLVNSGSSANLLAFFALTSPALGTRQIQRGDEVISVAASFPTTVSPIIQYGALPVFVDIDPETLNIDVSLLQSALSSKTKAVMLAHTLGNPFDIEAVKKFCDTHNLWLIEDNCDALGASYSDKLTGTWGDIGTSSFYPPHHMTMGEGGAVYTDNPQLKKILLSLRDWGRDCWCDSGVDNTCNSRFTQQFGSLPLGYDHKYVYSHFGFNLKATDMQAAIGLAQLDKLPSFIKKRKENFQYMYEKLKKFQHYFVLPKATEKSDPSWFGFTLTLKENPHLSRNAMAQYLESHHIQTRNLFAGNIIRQPMFSTLIEGIDYRVCGALNNTDKVMNNTLWFGVYPGIDNIKIDYIVDIIEAYIAESIS
jgi:CDP-6-deoxy-D-xylo-4-hexulose-3-dehydrase